VWNIAMPAEHAPVRSLPVGRTTAEVKEADVKALRRAVHQAIKRVTDDFEAFEFNTIISALMSLTNKLYDYSAAEGSPVWNEAIETYLKLLAPIVPHIAEELWAQRGLGYSIHQQMWPQYDAAAAEEETITLVVQVNGKVRDRFEAPADISEDEATVKALASETVQKFMDGKAPKMIKYVPGKLVSIVV
jgi:leucyl-tRNA synthetase